MNFIRTKKDVEIVDKFLKKYSEKYFNVKYKKDYWGVSDGRVLVLFYTINKFRMQLHVDVKDLNVFLKMENRKEKIKELFEDEKD